MEFRLDICSIKFLISQCFTLPGLPNGKFKMGNCDGCVGATGWGLRDPHLVNVA